jgi:hypothetical protein
MITRRMRWPLVLATAGAVVLVACSAGSAPPPPAQTATPTQVPATSALTTSASTAAPQTAAPPTQPDSTDPQRCTTAELTGSLGDSDAAAGSVYRTLILTNTGNRPCELRGFPGVSYVTGDDGHQIGPAAEMSGDRGGAVRLDVGGSAGATLQLVNVANFDPAVCLPTPVRGLRVYPPGDTASLFVATEGTGCAGTPPGLQLSVQTVTAR